MSTVKSRTSGVMHDCAVPACDVVVPREMLMCRAHWYAVPIAIRDEVWRTWRALTRRDIDPIAALKAYKEARRKAVEAVKAA